MCSARSMPEATPAEVMTPSSTKRASRSTVTSFASEARRPKAPQWVVPRRPSRRPARARSRAPVQTDAVRRAAAAVRRIQSMVSASWRTGRVPNPPGTSRRSMRGASANEWRGTSTIPPVAVTGSFVFATVKTSNSALSSVRRDSTPGSSRARLRTSKGPATSSKATPSKRSTPTFHSSMGTRGIPGRAGSRRIFPSSYPFRKARLAGFVSRGPLTARRPSRRSTRVGPPGPGTGPGSACSARGPGGSGPRA